MFHIKLKSEMICQHSHNTVRVKSEQCMSADSSQQINMKKGPFVLR